MLAFCPRIVHLRSLHPTELECYACGRYRPESTRFAAVSPVLLSACVFLLHTLWSDAGASGKVIARRVRPQSRSFIREEEQLRATRVPCDSKHAIYPRAALFRRNACTTIFVWLAPIAFRRVALQTPIDTYRGLSADQRGCDPPPAVCLRWPKPTLCQLDHSLTWHRNYF